MADFLPAFERMILNEGGYVLHTVQGDTGGMTYAGIARNSWPDWAGWKSLDRGETPPSSLVRDFYKREFWDKINGDLLPQDIARTMFDFAVNAGVGVAVKLAQVVLGLTPDGVMGPKSSKALSEAVPQLFMAQFALAKIARYEQIVSKNRSQEKFLLGWIRRALKEAV